MEKFCFELSPIIEKCRKLPKPECEIVTCSCGREERLDGPELECRFGITKNKNFIPGIPRDIFMKILAKLQKCPQLTQVNEDWDYIRRFYVTHEKKTLRTSVTLWACCQKLTTNCVHKCVENQIHFSQHSSNGIARVAMAMEKKPDDKHTFPFILNTDIVRIMLRKTFKYKCFTWIFSIVYSGKSRSEAEEKMKDDKDANFEIELEADTTHSYFQENDNLYISKSIFMKIQDILTLIPK